MATLENRILTTHAGSLPRPPELASMLGKLSRHEPVDVRELERRAFDATSAVIKKQLDAGIDIVNNGEQSRESFFTYVQHRMSGFSGKSQRPFMHDLVKYPTFTKLKLGELMSRIQVDLMHAPMATGEVRYTGREAVERECEDTLKALAEYKSRFAEAFMTAPSPGIIAAAMLNSYYPDVGDYVDALGDALRVEYETIVKHGFVLQLDCPDLAMERHTSFTDRPLSEFLGFVDRVIDSINRALQGVPRERVRMHVCWGNYEGPHDEDIALDEILPRLYQARVGALMLSMANPRHEHEYRCFKRSPLPPETELIVGVIDTTTNYVEHPEVVADRIERVANAVGDPRRLMAGTDCGFDTSAGLGEVAEEVVWQKMRAMVEGARIATQRLF